MRRGAFERQTVLAGVEIKAPLVVNRVWGLQSAIFAPVNRDSKYSDTASWQERFQACHAYHVSYLLPDCVSRLICAKGCSANWRLRQTGYRNVATHNNERIKLCVLNWQWWTDNICSAVDDLDPRGILSQTNKERDESQEYLDANTRWREVDSVALVPRKLRSEGLEN